MPVGAAIGGGTAIAGGLGALGSYFGAQAQTQYGQQALQAVQQMFQQSQQALNPFIQGGQGAFNQLLQYLPSLTTPFGATPGSGPTGQVNPQQTQAALQATPGYQFTLGQGEQAATNALTAQGLGGGASGNLGKGLINYASGLADTTYQQQYQNWLQQNQQAYGMYSGASGIGEQAAGALASAAGQAGGQMSNVLQGIGQGQAGAFVGGANALGSGVQGVGSGVLLSQLLSKLGGGSNPSAAGAFPINGTSASPYTGFNFFGSGS
jgi:hypothetical protein